MRHASAALLAAGLCLGLTACTRSSPAKAGAPFNACSLLQPAEIAAIVGSPIGENKSSVQNDEGFRVWQCFSQAADFNKSVVLTVTRSDPASPRGRSPKKFWERKFAQAGEDEESSAARVKGNKEEEEGHRSAPPTRVDGLGDEAFWVRSSGALYILKDDSFLRIALGSAGSEAEKIAHATALAQKALAHF